MLRSAWLAQSVEDSVAYFRSMQERTPADAELQAMRREYFLSHQDAVAPAEYDVLTGHPDILPAAAWLSDMRRTEDE